MRTASAYIYKLKNNTKGRTYKVQDTNHRLMTGAIYRGAIGCGPVNFDEIVYSINGCCNTVPYNANITVLYGGSPDGSGYIVYHGGTPSGSQEPILFGGSP